MRAVTNAKKDKRYNKELEEHENIKRPWTQEDNSGNNKRTI